ncbi:MAG: Arc family DNA-binding protein [Deltaproteobacteria bacterium]|nr:Arc family DNA-binding protein [Deltaproteobacteria bacterium]
MKIMKNTVHKKTERVTIATIPIVIEALRKVAKSNERSLNWQIERILKDWLLEKGEITKEDLE